MPPTLRRVLHGNQQCEYVLDTSTPSGVASLRVPLRICTSPRLVRSCWGVNFLMLPVHALAQLYRDMELTTRFSSATALIDTVSRTIVLTNVRLRHRVKCLPKTVHDIRLY
jgi:hypothetical protein